jgi:hypothetical protein
LARLSAAPAAFKPMSRAQVLTGKCWTTPVLSNGKIYCRNAKGDLVTATYFVIQVVSADPAKWNDNKIDQTLEIAPPQ